MISFSVKTVTLVVFVILQSNTFAQNCDEALLPAKNEIQRMRKSLSTLTTQEEYRERVKARYDNVQLLLFMAKACSQNIELSRQSLYQWQLIMETLASLEASAKTSAFTKFSDWREARQADIDACLIASHQSLKDD